MFRETYTGPIDHVKTLSPLFIRSGNKTGGETAANRHPNPQIEGYARGTIRIATAPSYNKDNM